MLAQWFTPQRFRHLMSRIDLGPKKFRDGQIKHTASKYPIHGMVIGGCIDLGRL